MIVLKQHIPAFFEGFEPKTERIESAADLEGVAWLRSWRETPDFHRFSVARDGLHSKLLMAEFNQGRKWWVVGILSADLPDLPSWVAIGSISPSVQ